MVRTNKAVLSLAVAGIFAGSASQAQASAFSLIEQSATGLGNAFAGAAAAAEDAGTIYYNPAGMTYLKGPTQLSTGVAFINLSTKFTDSGSVASGTGLPTIPPVPPLNPRPLGGTGGDAGSLSAVPNFYVAADIAPDWKAGIGVSVPFGLKTEYEGDWLGRFQAIKSEIMTLNINPSLAWKVNDTISLGAGVSYQQIDAELTSAVNNVAATFAGALALGLPAVTAAGAAAQVQATQPEGKVTVTGSDGAWGYNLGAMIQATPSTRIGITYRSPIKYHVTGSATVDNAPAAVAASISGSVSLDIKMPDSASVALQQRLGSSWILLADVSWMGWSKIKDLTIVRNDGKVISSTPENFKDTYRYGLGATYRASDAWSFKVGVALDQSPVNDTDRTPRLPDQDRTWVSVGAKYGLSNDATVDVGYAHLIIKDASINQSAGNPTAFGVINGSYKASVDILGAQFSYRF
jgi:long-chain fatty acid transport protein